MSDKIQDATAPKSKRKGAHTVWLVIAFVLLSLLSYTLKHQESQLNRELSQMGREVMRWYRNITRDEEEIARLVAQSRARVQAREASQRAKVEAFVAEQQAKLPKRLDHSLLFRAVHLEEKTLHFDFTYTPPEPVADQLGRKRIEAAIGDMYLEPVCNYKVLRRFQEYGYKVRYTYADSEGEPIAAHDFTYRTCEQYDRAPAWAAMVAARVEPLLPKQLDELTTLVGIRAEGRELEFAYRVTGFKAQGERLEKFRARVPQHILANLCPDPDVQTHLRKLVIPAYKYVDEQGRSFGRLVVHSATCVGRT